MTQTQTQTQTQTPEIIKLRKERNYTRNESYTRKRKGQKMDKNPDRETTIYKMIFSDGTFYIGRTTMNLKLRITMHKNNANFGCDMLVSKKIREQLKLNASIMVEVIEVIRYENSSKIELEIIKQHKDDKDCLNQRSIIKEKRKNMSTSKWVNDGIVNKRVQVSELDYYFNLGFNLGRTKNKIT